MTGRLRQRRSLRRRITCVKSTWLPFNPAIGSCSSRPRRPKCHASLSPRIRAFASSSAVAESFAGSSFRTGWMCVRIGQVKRSSSFHQTSRRVKRTLRRLENFPQTDGRCPRPTRSCRYHRRSCRPENILCIPYRAATNASIPKCS